MSVSGRDNGAGAQARAGTDGDPSADGVERLVVAKPAPEERTAKQTKLPSNGEHARLRRRGKPDLTPDLERLANVGKPKLVPDRSSTERFLSLSRIYKKKLLRWLWDNVDTTWPDPEDLYNEASWYAGCSPTTAKRWIKQFTSRLAPFDLREAEDYHILELRKKNGGNNGGKMA